MNDLRATARRATGDRGALARHWLVLAIGSLAASGLLAFGVVAARIPALARHWTDTDLAHRILVVHVDLGVVAWFSALPVAVLELFALARAAPPAGPLARLAPWLSTAGAILLLAGLLPGLGTPFTVNYVPLIDHPLYFAALTLLFAGVAAAWLERARPRAWRPGRGLAGPVALAGGRPLPESVAATLGASGPLLAVGGAHLLLALFALAVTLARLPAGLARETHFETLMWGGGHVFQFANLAFALVAWAMLAAWGTGRELVRRTAWAAAALALPVLPILFLLAGDPLGWRYRPGFAALMQWGLFPAALLFLAVVLAPHAARRGSFDAERRAAALWPLAASLVLMLAGFAFGAAIRGSDLRIPGHYHACIGAVTLAYMALTLLLPESGAGAGDPARTRRRDRALRSVALLYGGGQLVFASGLVLAGTYGLGRKTYGVEQTIANAGQTAGVVVMAIGGALALAGGATWALAAFSRWRESARR